MGALQKVEAMVRANLPTASFKITPPKNLETGVWFLDITHGTNTVVVELSKQGLGVSYAGADGSDREIGYGERPQQFYEDESKALQEIYKMLKE